MKIKKEVSYDKWPTVIYEDPTGMEGTTECVRVKDILFKKGSVTPEDCELYEKYNWRVVDGSAISTFLCRTSPAGRHYWIEISKSDETDEYYDFICKSTERKMNDYMGG